MEIKEKVFLSSLSPKKCGSVIRKIVNKKIKINKL